MLINDLIHIGRERDGIGAKETEDGEMHSWAFALTQHPQIKKKDPKEKGKPGWKGILNVCQAVLTNWAWDEGEAMVEEGAQ